MPVIGATQPARRDLGLAARRSAAARASSLRAERAVHVDARRRRGARVAPAHAVDLEVDLVGDAACSAQPASASPSTREATAPSRAEAVAHVDVSPRRCEQPAPGRCDGTLRQPEGMLAEHRRASARRSACAASAAASACMRSPAASASGAPSAARRMALDEVRVDRRPPGTPGARSMPHEQVAVRARRRGPRARASAAREPSRRPRSRVGARAITLASIGS